MFSEGVELEPASAGLAAEIRPILEWDGLGSGGSRRALATSGSVLGPGVCSTRHAFQRLRRGPDRWEFSHEIMLHLISRIAPEPRSRRV